MLHVHIVVHGEVQGVGFRYFAMKMASRYGINGWVCNNRDGTVEIDAEGSEANIREFVAAMQKGNGIARIESFDIDTLPDMENHQTFDVVYR